MIVAIVAGSAVMVEDWREEANAIPFSFYAGMEGGTALAQVLTGAVNPSGKPPFTVARDEAHSPFFDRDADEINYDLWHGYTKLKRDGHDARHPFGHGLSYTDFAYRAINARPADNAIEVSVAVTNTGSIAGEEVVQCYIGAPGIEAPRAVKQFKGFDRVALAPGETKVARMCVALDTLRWRDGARWRLEHGPYRVYMGGSSASCRMTTLIV